MAMAVFVDPPARFKAWLASQAKPARSPRTALERRGREVFLANACAGCHTIRGTAANGRIGPDLTHVKGRTSLAALTIPNTDASIAAWIQNPQHFKPGNKMPALGLAGPDLRAVVAYLRSLR
jgi:cytochrome c oxidase subunit 2